MGTSEIALVVSFFIGLMMAISPCPLTTNITAIAYISKKLDKKKTLWVGLAYTLGRMFTYVTITSLIVWFGLSMQLISLSLQNYGEKALGPLLLIVGLVILEVIQIPVPNGNPKLEEIKQKLSEKGFLGSFLLGVIFALAFCPFSADLFFGMLIPLAIKAGDGLIIPAVFTIATGLPVILFSLILVYSLSSLGPVVSKVQVFEKWTRRAVSAVFMIVGIYYTLSVTLGFSEWHGVPRSKIKWNPTVDKSKCVGCGMCITGCGRNVYDWDSKENKSVVARPNNCLVGCVTCSNTCLKK
ncbi:MAG: aromatic aminobenezylarsenical efflux permease ArsG family transporter [Candidatus Kryptoniota bacterium]